MDLIPRRFIKRVFVGVAILFALGIIVIQARHHFEHGHFAAFGIHVDALSMDGSIGIPGQTKLYWTEVTNFGLWPVSFTGCDYVTDAFEPGT
jgi:hypothetical protein